MRSKEQKQPNATTVATSWGPIVLQIVAESQSNSFQCSLFFVFLFGCQKVKGQKSKVIQVIPFSVSISYRSRVVWKTSLLMIRRLFVRSQLSKPRNVFLHFSRVICYLTLVIGKYVSLLGIKPLSKTVLKFRHTQSMSPKKN